MNTRYTLLGLLIAGLVGSVGAAKDDKAAKMTPEMQAAMAQMEKYAAPGEGHKALEPLVGQWTFVSKMTMKPGEKPMEGKGSMTTVWAYGGRFLKRDFTSDCSGQTMAGVGYTGYDTIRGEYQEVWLGDMGTSMMQGTGTYNAATKTFNISGQGSDPMTGAKNKPFRAEVKVIDNDNHTYTMFDKGPDGKEFPMMVETYKRVK